MICIIGGGPSCIALLCCMIKNNMYKKIKHKIIVFETSSVFGSGALKEYQIRSNSSLSSILEIVPEHIKETFSDDTKQLVKSVNYDTCYLPVIGKLFEEVGMYFKRDICVLTSTKVVKVSRDCVHTKDKSYSCSKIISCLGGTLQTNQGYISSQRFLSGLEPICSDDVLIIGGSHSAWSVAWKLLKNRFKGTITMYSRSKIKVHCINEEEANDIGFVDYTKDDICPDTNGIFRFAGLRGDSKQLWMMRNTIKNLSIVYTKPTNTFKTIIQAYGYKPNTIEGIEHTHRFGFMCGIEEKSGEPSFKKSKDGIWIYGNTLGTLFLKKHFKSLF